MAEAGMDGKREREAGKDTDTNAGVGMGGKRPRTSLDLMVVKERKESERALVAAGPPRTSSLASPIMMLSGHAGEVYTMKFAPNGEHLASAGFDKILSLWKVYGECENYLVLPGHQNAVLEVQWSSDGLYLFTASADKSVMVWDVEAERRIKRWNEHRLIVNSCCPSRRGMQLCASGSDDRSARVWDLRQKRSVHTLQHAFQVTCVAFMDDATQLCTGGLDNSARVWDLRKGDVVMTLDGHTDTLTGMEVSTDGSYLLTNAMDNTVRIWDLRPYAPADRCVKIFRGATHNYEKHLLRCAWSPDGSQVTAGSSDRFVYVWDTTSRRILYKLPGHAGSVNEVDFHPKEPIVGSCSSDRNIFLGELGQH